MPTLNKQELTDVRSCLNACSDGPSIILQMDAMGKMRNISELLQSKSYRDRVS